MSSGFKDTVGYCVAGVTLLCIRMRYAVVLILDMSLESLMLYLICNHHVSMVMPYTAIIMITGHAGHNWRGPFAAG
jgi:hypothetical protein